MTRARTLSLLGNENNFTVTNTSPNRVGVGSTQPDGKLDVGGDIVVGTAITISSVSGIISATDFYVDGVSITGAAGTWATFTSGGEGGISTTKKVKIENGLEVTGISTFSGDLTVGGVLTYDDVTNVDSVGIITAQSYVSIADSIVHTGDTDTSIRFPSADTFTVETAGSERLRVNSSGDVGVGTITPGAPLEIYNSGPRIRLKDSDGTDTYAELSASTGAIFISHRNGASNGQLIFQGLGGGSVSEYARFDTTGRLLVGATSARSSTGAIQVETAGTTDRSRFESFTNINSAAGTHITLGKSRGTTAGSNTIVQVSDELGALNFHGTDGANDIRSAQIKCVVDSTPGSNDMPGRLVFSTTADGASTVTERLRITSSGNVGINSTNPAYLLDIASGSASMRLNSTSTSTLVITSGASNAARIEFGDLANNDTGYIYYDNSDDSMQFATNGSTERMRITSAGDLIVDAGGDAQDIQIKSHSANSGHGIIYMRGNASGERSSIQLNHFGHADWLISAGATGNGEFSITNTDQGTDGIKLNTDGDLLPAADNSLDLGSTSLRWANVYSADLQLSNEGSSNDVDGTWGQYTIQEGENDLFLLNRRNGKKYRFMLEEV